MQTNPRAFGCLEGVRSALLGHGPPSGFVARLARCSWEASTRADAWFAIWTGLVATAAWTLLVLGWRGYRLRRALGAFVGSYEVHKKLREDGPSARLAITRGRGRLADDFTESEDGEIGGRVTLSERFPRSGRGAYEHRLPDGRLAWGTWEAELVASGEMILVTTRYAHPDKQIEIVQGAEWRRSD